MAMTYNFNAWHNTIKKLLIQSMLLDPYFKVDGSDNLSQEEIEANLSEYLSKCAQDFGFHHENMSEIDYETDDSCPFGLQACYDCGRCER